MRAHIIAAICSHLGMSKPTDSLVHECSRERLESTPKSFIKSRVLPSKTKDPVYVLYWSFLYTGFMHIDLRNAIWSEEGQHIIHQWKHWSVLFLGLNKYNYSKEARTCWPTSMHPTLSGLPILSHTIEQWIHMEKLDTANRLTRFGTL